MNALQQDTNQLRQSAVIAGISLLIMTLAAFFSYGYIHSSLIISGDSIATLENLQASAGLFRAEILGWLIILILDIVVSWAFYIYLKPIQQGYSLLAAWLRLIYTAILAIAIANLVQVGTLINQSEQLFASSPTALAPQIMIAVQTFESVWSLGLIIFGLHLLAIGLIALKTKKIPKVISILLTLAGISYILVHLLHGFFPKLDTITSILEMILSIPMIAGELGFGIWLLIRGGRAPLTDA
ncbi:DUF4386 domain-containing protein [Vallitalea okinawensis]|uniref:DUF4386 domain-containing protein n=1 Tax=Vallitalea okinawensis TaxID=2078660 RepID=UPI000CFBDD8A|nr:DUF4386 domain-containing protein [Vallitalea okinawensis]